MIDENNVWKKAIEQMGKEWQKLRKLKIGEESSVTFADNFKIKIKRIE